MTRKGMHERSKSRGGACVRVRCLPHCLDDRISEKHILLSILLPTSRSLPRVLPPATCILLVYRRCTPQVGEPVHQQALALHCFGIYAAVQKSHLSVM